MISYNDMSFGINIAAVIICLADLVFTIMSKRTSKPQNKVFITICLLLLANGISGVATTMLNDLKDSSESAFRTFKAMRYFYFIAHTMIPPLFIQYVSHVTGYCSDRRNSWLHSRSLKNFFHNLLPFMLIMMTMILIITNPIHNIMWHFTSDHQFVRGWGEFVFIYTFSAVWVVISIVMMLRYWNILSVNRQYGLMFCYLLVVMGVLVQLLYSNIRIEVLMEAIGITGVLMFVENDDDRKNVELGVYNSAAFSQDVSTAIKNKTPIEFLLIRDIHFDRTSDNMISAKTDLRDIGRAVTSYMLQISEKNNVYSPATGVYAIAYMNSTHEETAKAANDLLERFTFPWNVNNTEVFLNAAVIIVDFPEMAKTAEDIIYIAECPIPDDMANKVMQGSELDWIMRHSAVETALKNGLENGVFEVYYQPTYNIDKSLYGAEALLRMQDVELGMVMPDEFIPIAEQLGMIDDIDEFVLEEVCSLLKTGLPQKFGIGHINVNLSVQECLKSGFADNIIKIVSETGIDRSHISFEITESVGATDYTQLSNVIDTLKEAGFTFYIDDFGTGYSNMSSLFALGADVIKVDKSVLWGAKDNKIGMVLLKDIIGIIKDMKKRSLAEGVETEEQLQTLTELGCDHLQGYYFSKPLPKEQFLELIKNAAEDR